MADTKHILLRAMGGAGRNLMATAVARELRLASVRTKTPIHLSVQASWPDMWAFNPHADRVYGTGAPHIFEQVVNQPGAVIIDYNPYTTGEVIRGEKHVAVAWAEYALWATGFPPPKKGISPDPVLRFTGSERQVARRQLTGFRAAGKPLLFLQAFGGPPRAIPEGIDVNPQVSWARDIPPAQAAALVEALSPHYTILSLQHRSSPDLANTIGLADMPLRTSLALLPEVDELVLIDSVVQHAAVPCGRTAHVFWPVDRVAQLGYDVHINVRPEEPAASCPIMPAPGHIDPLDILGAPPACPYEDLTELFDVASVAETLIESAT